MEQHQPDQNQEIDLSQVSKKIGGFFGSIANGIFRWILFLRRNIVWAAALFIMGAGLGLYLDKTGKTYEHGLIVQPNFGSTDYLYGKIELINAKAKEGDTIFLKNVVGIKKPKKFSKIEIKPIPDIYRFIENKAENFELIKLMAENGDIKKILEDNVTSKNYSTHAITIITGGKTTDAALIDPLMKYLNDSDYFNQLQKVVYKNVEEKIVQNDSIISQINGFLNAISENAKSPKNDKLVYYNENTQLNDVIKTKDQLINEQAIRRIELINSNVVVKKLSETLNVRDLSGAGGKMKFILPIALVLLFMIGHSLRKTYKNKLRTFQAS